LELEVLKVQPDSLAAPGLQVRPIIVTSFIVFEYTF